MDIRVIILNKQELIYELNLNIMQGILIAFAIYLILFVVGIAIGWYGIKHAKEIDKDDTEF